MADNNRKLLYHKSAPSVVIVSSHDQHNLVAHSLKKRNILQAVHVEYVSQIFAGEYGKICKGNIVSVADSCFS